MIFSPEGATEERANPSSYFCPEEREVEVEYKRWTEASRFRACFLCHEAMLAQVLSDPRAVLEKGEN